MVSYTRHLMHIFRKAGAEYTYENRVLLDKIIRKELDMEKADADEVWKEVKPMFLAREKTDKAKKLEEKIVNEFIRKILTG